MAEIFEYRGVSDLVYAEVTCDDNSTATGHGYVTGTVKPLAGVATLSKASNNNSEVHYYDNLPAIVVQGLSADTVTISCSALPLAVKADILGQTYDAATGTYIEAEGTTKTFAIGYKTQATDGSEYYCFRLKGTFQMSGDETHQTKNDGTDANGEEITFTGISTTHKFTKTGAPAMAVTVNTALDLIANKDQFFASVQTPDTIVAKVQTPSVSVVPSRAELTAGEDVALEAIVVPAGTAVSWSSSATTYATVANGVVHGEAAGSATITASITVDGNTYTDTCAVTVNAIEA